MDSPFEPDPDCPFNERPDEKAQPRQEWALSPEAAALVFGVRGRVDRAATEEERREIAERYHGKSGPTSG